MAVGRAPCEALSGFSGGNPLLPAPRAQNFGLTFRLVQAVVISRPNRLEGFAFKDDGDDGDEPMDGAAEGQPAEEEF